MITQRDLDWTRLAREKGWLGEKERKAALLDANTMRGSGHHPIEEILLAKGYLDPVQVGTLQRVLGEWRGISAAPPSSRRSKPARGMGRKGVLALVLMAALASSLVTLLLVQAMGKTDPDDSPEGEARGSVEEDRDGGADEVGTPDEVARLDAEKDRQRQEERRRAEEERQRVAREVEQRRVEREEREQREEDLRRLEEKNRRDDERLVRCRNEFQEAMTGGWQALLDGDLARALERTDSARKSMEGWEELALPGQTSAGQADLDYLAGEVESLQKSLELSGTDPLLDLDFVEGLERAGYIDLAADGFRVLLAGENRTDDERAAGLLGLGRILLYRGRATRDDDEKDLWFRRALPYLVHFETRFGASVEVEAVRSMRVQTLLYLGILAQRTGEKERVDLFEEVLQVFGEGEDPSDERTRVHRLLAMALLGHRETRATATRLIWGTESRMVSLVGYLIRAMALLAGGDEEGAKGDLEVIRGASSDDPDTIETIARLAAMARELEDAPGDVRRRVFVGITRRILDEFPHEGVVEAGRGQNRFPGRRDPGRFPGDVKAAIDLGLDWLSRHQEPSGRWDADGFGGRCMGEKCPGNGEVWVDVGLTGLGLLAFLAAGETPGEGEHRDAVSRGLLHLLERQDEDGCFGLRENHYTYNHAIATLAMAEAYGLTGHRDLRESAIKGVEFLVSAQNRGHGWRYSVQPGDNDTSVTGWCMLALFVARKAGLEVPGAVFEGTRNWIDAVTDHQYFRTGYIQRGDSGCRLQGQLGKFAQAESNTAISILFRLLSGDSQEESVIPGQVALIEKNPPRWDRQGGANGTSQIDFYYWRVGTLAMYQVGGSHWNSWWRSVRRALVSNQIRAGCARGSWQPVGAWGSPGGRVYATAINTITLATPGRIPRDE